MAVSDVSIANNALSKIGAGQIISFADDTTQAKEVSKRYAAVRDAELTRRNWRFSVTRLSIAASVTTPVFGYAHQYPLPADCLKVLSAGDSSPGLTLADFIDGVDSQDYTLEGRVILTDYGSPLHLRYVKRVTDPTQFDAAFAEAFASRLGYELAVPLGVSATMKQQAGDDYKFAISEAIRSNAVQQPPQPIADDSWLASRR